jgi:hypothetical protein
MAGGWWSLCINVGISLQDSAQLQRLFIHSANTKKRAGAAERSAIQRARKDVINLHRLHVDSGWSPLLPPPPPPFTRMHTHADIQYSWISIMCVCVCVRARALVSVCHEVKEKRKNIALFYFAGKICLGFLFFGPLYMGKKENTL